MMAGKLTKKEIEQLRDYVRWCYDTMNHPRISPRVLSILLNAYTEEGA
ncbi:Uncharacterised protein [Bacillus pumilus]|nr:Uncharacterised protein [Bacillus pumilus]